MECSCAFIVIHVCIFFNVLDNFYFIVCAGCLLVVAFDVLILCLIGGRDVMTPVLLFKS